MHPLRKQINPSAITIDQSTFTISALFHSETDNLQCREYSPPRIFYAFALISMMGILSCIIVSILFAPNTDPMFHFNEDGAITSLSSVCLAMAAALAAIVFYLRLEKMSFGTFFWFVLALGCLFLSLDEQLMFHERGGQAIKTTGFDAPDQFRNWNDLIVIGYGLIAVIIAKLFWKEISRCRVFAILFATGFCFYAIHTGIDSMVPSSVYWKDIPEESAKLLCVFTLFLAVTAQLLAMLDQLFEKRSS